MSRFQILSGCKTLLWDDLQQEIIEKDAITMRWTTVWEDIFKNTSL